jgi:hypothetical protein
MSWEMFRPKTLASPPLPLQWPALSALRRKRTPSVGRTPIFFAALEDEIQLRGHLEHEDDLQAHLLRIERQVDELLVLVAIADDVGLRVVHVASAAISSGLLPASSP